MSGITPLPTPPSTSDPSNFSTRADDFLAALPTFATEANDLAAALNNISTTSTSVTSNTIGTGSKAFTVDIDKSYAPGQSVTIARTSDTDNRMFAVVDSYDSGTGALVVTSQAFEGSGTFTDWTITLGFNGIVSNAQLADDAKFGRFINQQIFTSSGTYTPTTGTKSIYVEVQGAGGGGGGSSSTNDRTGAGGGAGGYAAKHIELGAITSATITIGAAGTGGTNTTSGSAGGTSSYADGINTLTCTGGAGGIVGDGSQSPSDGGTGTGGDINITGKSGGRGGGTGSTVNGLGGDSRFGFGGMPDANSAPDAATGYGAGGGGGDRTSSSSSAGGAGRAGLVIIWEYA